MQLKEIIFYALIIGPTLGMADEFHNVNQIVGDRSIGMAGAYGAVSDDPAGMVYNPAGIAFANSASMSANVNTLQWSKINYHRALQKKYDYQRSSYQVLPNFFGVVQPFGDLMVGFSSAIVDSTQEKQDQSFENIVGIERFVVNLNNLKTTYNVGPTIAKRVSNKVAIGVSMPLHYRTTEFIANQSVLYEAGAVKQLEWSNIYRKKTEQGLRPKLGVIVNPLPKVSIGLTIDNTIVLAAHQTIQESQCSTNTTDIGCSAQTNPEIIEYSLLPRYPVQIRVAGAWFPNSALLVSSDVIYNSAVKATEGFTAKEMTLDGALGLEWYWTPRWAVRSGVFTSMANTPELNNTDTYQNPHIDRYGGTISFARFSQGSSISLGVMAVYGEGQTQLFGSIPKLIQTTTSLNLNAFFTTSYRY